MNNIDHTNEYYMQLAIEQAKLAEQTNETPIGAIVVYDPIDLATRKHILDKPQIIARAHNKREVDNNPCGHAEFLAMLEASRKLNNWRLSGCTVYITLEPCIMCAGLMLQSRIDKCVFGAFDSKAGALKTLFELGNDSRLNHRFEVVGGILESNCSLLLTDFFTKLRNAKSKNKNPEK